MKFKVWMIIYTLNKLEKGVSELHTYVKIFMINNCMP